MTTVRNIVCTVNLGCRLDLKTIAMRARNAEYNPKRCVAVFAGGVVSLVMVLSLLLLLLCYL